MLPAVQREGKAASRQSGATPFPAGAYLFGHRGEDSSPPQRALQV